MKVCSSSEHQAVGLLFFNSYGDVEEVDVDGSYRVDNGHAVAWEPSLDYEITRGWTRYPLVSLFGPANTTVYRIRQNCGCSRETRGLWRVGSSRSGRKPAVATTKDAPPFFREGRLEANAGWARS